MQESITITVKGHPVILDKDFAKDFDPSEWQAMKHKGGNYYYVGITGPRMNGKSGKVLLLHRLLMCAKDDEIVDHINGNTLDNRKINLRKCTRGENSRNRVARHDCKSGIRGVYFRPPNLARRQKNGVWVANLGAMIDGKHKRLHLGHFKTKEKASQAFDEAVEKYHGEFGRKNDITRSGGTY